MREKTIFCKKDAVKESAMQFASGAKVSVCVRRLFFFIGTIPDNDSKGTHQRQGNEKDGIHLYGHKCHDGIEKTVVDHGAKHTFRGFVQTGQKDGQQQPENKKGQVGNGGVAVALNKPKGDMPQRPGGAGEQRGRHKAEGFFQKRLHGAAPAQFFVAAGEERHHNPNNREHKQGNGRIESSCGQKKQQKGQEAIQEKNFPAPRRVAEQKRFDVALVCVVCIGRQHKQCGDGGAKTADKKERSSEKALVGEGGDMGEQRQYPPREPRDEKSEYQVFFDRCQMGVFHQYLAVFIFGTSRSSQTIIRAEPEDAMNVSKGNEGRNRKAVIFL